jgi:outer membrane protein assembly factor BamB
MWPSEGVYVYALRAEDGEVLWENNTSGSDYVKQPHPGAFSMTGVSPQGYVLGREGRLFVPTGRSVPAAYDRQTGKLLYYRSAPTNWGNRWGGCWNFLAGDYLFGWRAHHGPDIDVQLGEYPPDRNDGLIAFEAANGQEKREFPGKLCAVVRGNTLYASGSGKVTAYDLAAWMKGAKAADRTRWEADHGRAYEMILAGSRLVVGGVNSVTVFNADDGRRLWRDTVKGQARGLAASGGRLLVSTTEGRIVCYGADAVDKPRVVTSGATTGPLEPGDADSPAAALARQMLHETKKKAGYCVVLGAGDGKLLYHLAQQSDLTIHCVEPSEKKVADLRRRLDAAHLYGARVVLHHGPLRDLSLPDYVADLIILREGTSRHMKQCSASEVYRILRPHGGVVHIPPAEPAGISLRGAGRFLKRVITLGSAGPFSASAIAEWLRRGGVPETEIGLAPSAVQVVRGALPGSGNWTHQYANAGRTGCSTDERVRLPLKLLWFGRPGPARLVTRHWGGPSPLCVNGRMFVIGQFSLMAVDAYNGRALWRRDFPSVAWWPVRVKGSSAAADEDSVYLVTGKACLRLDAATGETLHTYPLPLPSDISGNEAKALRWSTLAAANDRILGSAGTDRAGRWVFCFGKDGKLRWSHAANGTVGNNALSMDASRVYLIDGVSPDDAAKARRRGKTLQAGSELIAIDAATGKPVWRTREGVKGRTELWLAGDVLLATDGRGMTGYQAASGEHLYSREARLSRFPVVGHDTIYAEPAAYDLGTGEPKERDNPFTNGKAPWQFRRSYGCGAIAGGPNVLLFRSGTLGIYDLAGDGGVHNFGGVRAGCYVNAIAANGLVLAPPADAACTCSYSFRTTVALAPAEKQRDWSIFYDRLPPTSVTKAAFNLGAPGDRRDPQGRVWLALPRPETRTRRSDIAVPFRFTVEDGFGPYRQESERAAVDRTDRPWLYSSGLKGLRRAEIDLEVLDRGVTSWPAKQAPVVDGRSDDACWEGYRPVPLASERASVMLRHDADNLYLLYKRPVAVDETGKAVAWRRALGGTDAAVWKDHSFEVYLSSVPQVRDAPCTKCLHLGVSASGASYDALWTYVTPTLPTLDVPRVEVTIDGRVEDWGDQGLNVVSLPGRNGRLRAPGDFDPSLRIGWNDRGVVVLVQVADNVVHEWPNEAQLWLGDSVDICVLLKAGVREGYRCIVTPGSAPKHAPKTRFHDLRADKGGKLAAEVAGQKTSNGYLLEILLPWSNLKLTPALGAEFAMQLIVTDDDKRGDRHRFQALWHQAGDATRDPLACQAFRLADKAGPPLVFRRSRKKDREGFFAAAPPHPLPVTLPSLGGKPEDARYNARWSSMVLADARAFTAELAIPWQTLADAGLDASNLIADLQTRGPLRRAPVKGEGYEQLIRVPDRMARPRTLSVRLHFAEIEDGRRGQRIFDVKLQGQTVLEDFDVVRSAGGRNRAVVREFHGIVAERALVLELVAKAADLTDSTAPIISAIEIMTDSGSD